MGGRRWIEGARHRGDKVRSRRRRRLRLGARWPLFNADGVERGVAWEPSVGRLRRSTKGRHIPRAGSPWGRQRQDPSMGRKTSGAHAQWRNDLRVHAWTLYADHPIRYAPASLALGYIRGPKRHFRQAGVTSDAGPLLGTAGRPLERSRWSGRRCLDRPKPTSHALLQQIHSGRVAEAAPELLPGISRFAPKRVAGRQ